MNGLLSLTGFRSFNSRLIVFLMALMLPVLGVIYLFVKQNNQSYTAQTIDSYLQSGAEVFDFTLQQQTRTLVSILTSLTWDFGFRTAYGSGDPGTLFDASLNVLDRSQGGVEFLMVVDLDGNVVIDTALQGYEKVTGSWAKLVKRADRSQERIADDLIMVHGIPHRLIAVPMYLPRQVAWIVGGFPLNQQVLDRVRQSTLSDISLLRIFDGRAEVLSSTFPESHWQDLASQYDLEGYGASYIQRLNLNNQSYGTLSRWLNEDSLIGERLVALVHRSYQENLVNEKRFEQLLGEFYLLAIAACVFAMLLLSRSITRPIQRLADFVGLIEQGDYHTRINLDTQDELGTLADSVNNMASGLAEKEKVRDLLGKVVSRQIADQLIKNPVNLEGEEKVVTIMYADIKGFTSYCEGKRPADVLKVLNRYLSSVAGQVEEYHGVVDKFIGDGVMALYGAPIQTASDVDNALNTALRIRARWCVGNSAEGTEAENDDLCACIGIHTGLVVAGNLGSSSRLNYSVIGDTVNLAARLESLTRYYGVACIVSEDTARNAGNFLFRELDIVQVYGRSEAVRIFELMGHLGRVTSSVADEVRQFQRFLAHYRNRQWDKSEEILTGLSGRGPYQALYELYLDRIAYFREHPPGQDWRGIFIFDRK